ncbi:MbtH family protein [Streptomyces sp. NBC_01217]|uniref:MbtH family protein n=1 Tax=Streptomyces sp. NBC_01217 TaxID=2903779 RepID=UPI002E0F9830|nr:MbtH family protein [Streptomyces sp. NBC_01217]
MTNPFEDSTAHYFVLSNKEGQHSLRPVRADVPEGWEITIGEAPRQDCLDYVERSWADMRPRSPVAAMEESSVSVHGEE